MNIPKEVLDKAADAAESRHENWGSWEDVARAVIEVAGPTLMADAFEDGVFATARASAKNTAPINPYRA